MANKNSNNSDWRSATSNIKGSRNNRTSRMIRAGKKAADDANIEKQHVRNESPGSFRAYVEMRDAQRTSGS